MNSDISILLRLELTVVKNVFCDVNCVKCKNVYGSMLHFSQVRKTILKTKIMNAYFQHLLYYNSERKDLKH